MTAEDFARLTGRRAEGVWAAPGRVNLIGEHTDYNGGFVLPFAIEASVQVAAARRADALLRVWSRQEGGPVEIPVDAAAPGAVRGWPAYAVGAVALLAATTDEATGLDLVVDSAVPRGSGLSSSAALTCAVLAAAANLYDVDVERVDLARLAQRVEHDYAGVPVGLMDPLASLLGRPAAALLVDCRSVSVEPVPLDPAAHGLALLVVDTGVSRQLAGGAYADRRRDCEEAARRLGLPALRDATVESVAASADRLGPVLTRRARHVVSENARTVEAAALLRAGRLPDVGLLLDASHASLRDDFEVSWSQADAAVEAALGAGAIGARLTGAGFGGCVVALVREARTREMADAVAARAAADGSPRPRVFSVQPSAGAHRVC